jgi:hypothetical protein
MKLIIPKSNLRESAKNKPLESVIPQDLVVNTMLLHQADLVAVVEGDSALLLKNRDGATGFVISKSQLTEMLLAE